MNAPVTPTHRALAFGAIWRCPPSNNEREWIVTGEGVGGGPLLRGAAQALADFGAKQARKAWTEGYEQGALDEADALGEDFLRISEPTPNPYPEILP